MSLACEEIWLEISKLTRCHGRSILISKGSSMIFDSRQAKPSQTRLTLISKVEKY
jgi:hypothetical protein